MHEPLPLAIVHAEILRFLRNREDAVVFGAHAVNAHVAEGRMTQDVDVLSTRAAEVAEELRAHLNSKFGIAMRTRSVAGGIGFRVFQRRKEGNRHLVDVRQVDGFPPTEMAEGVRVPTAAVLVAQKVKAYAVRRAVPKGGTDWRDIGVLLTTYPHLKVADGEVAGLLEVDPEATPATRDTWREIVDTPIEVPGEDDDLAY